MYITNQSIQYPDIRVTRTDGTVRFEGASLAGVSALSGSIARIIAKILLSFIGTLLSIICVLHISLILV